MAKKDPPLRHQLGELLTSGEGTDCVVHVDGEEFHEEFHVHALILKMRSPYPFEGEQHSHRNATCNITTST